MHSNELQILLKKIFSDPDLKRMMDQPGIPGKTIEDFKSEYLKNFKHNFSNKYKLIIEQSFKQFTDLFGDIELTKISRELVQKFILRKYKKSPAAAALYYRTLKAAFTRALDWEYISENPFTRVKLPKRQKSIPAYLSEDQLLKIIQKETSELLKDIYFVLFDTGLRAGELISLKWNETKLQERLIQVGSEKFTTKTKKIRFVPMTERVYRILSGRVPKIIRLDSFVFCKKSRFPFSVNYISKRFKQACRLAGVDERVHLHTLRHSMASNLIQRNVNLYHVKEILGHNSITTTEVYSHLNIDTLREAVSKLDGSVVQ